MDPKIHSTVTDQLREDIRVGRLPPGSVLRQDVLASRFGVSRQPIRLAIASLQASGLVTVRRDRSVEVVTLSYDALRDLVAVRLLVEREALVRAIPHRTERSILGAKHLQARIEVEAEPGQLEELDCAFHSALYGPCRNARLLKLIDDLRRENRHPYEEQPVSSKQRASWSKQHRNLLRRYAAGDRAGAVMALEEHLAEVRKK